ncbi:unnamed protein product, partial [Acanthocheilonema viteae]
EDGMAECAPGDENAFTTSTTMHILKHHQPISLLSLFSFPSIVEIRGRRGRGLFFDLSGGHLDNEW